MHIQLEELYGTGGTCKGLLSCVAGLHAAELWKHAPQEHLLAIQWCQQLVHWEGQLDHNVDLDAIRSASHNAEWQRRCGDKLGGLWISAYRNTTRPSRYTAASAATEHMFATDHRVALSKATVITPCYTVEGYPLLSYVTIHIRYSQSPFSLAP